MLSCVHCPFCGQGGCENVYSDIKALKRHLKSNHLTFTTTITSNNNNNICANIGLNPAAIFEAKNTI